MTLALLPRHAWLAALLGLSTLAAQAQNEPIKYGKLDAKLFDAAQYPVAAGAPAVVLCDYGTSRIEGADEGFRVVFDRVTRVLILDKAGYDEATVHIPLYHHEDREEKLQNLRGATYNLVDGKLQKQELDAKAVFSERLDERRNLRKFTLPGVRAGSIIEYAYTIKSDFLFNLQDWRFQRGIPVVWSEYRAVMPSFYQYKLIPHGFLPYKIQETDVVPYHTSYRSAVKDGYGTSYTNSNSGLLTANAVRCRWAMENVPAFRDEPFMTTASDYLAGIDFELNTVVFDPSRPQSVTSTWEKISKELLTHADFGGYLDGRTALTAPAAALATTYPDPAARAAAVLALVQQAVRYNGEERLYATQPTRRVLEQQRGNSAEVNLLLVRTLRDAGLTAAPLLVSTRRHGRVQTEIPLLSQFNYVVAAVAQDAGADLLLDATEPTAAAGTLPERCLNGQGRLVAPEGRWVALKPSQKFMRVTNARLQLAADGRVQGNLHREYAGYAGLAERNRLAEQGEKAYLGTVQQQYADWQLSRSAVAQAGTLDKPLVLDLDLALGAAAGPGAAERLYLPLMQFFTDRQNPFQPDNRLYPVDFATLREDIVSVSLALPPGYTVEELPKNLLLNLPNGDGRYAFEVMQRDNVLYLNSRLQLRKTEFMPGEYAALRELFTRSLAKHTEPLVLRRTP